MTKRDYKNLAYILHMRKKDFKSPATLRRFTTILCKWLQTDNPRFNRALFIEAVYDPKFWGYHPETKEKQQSFFKEE